MKCHFKFRDLAQLEKKQGKNALVKHSFSKASMYGLNDDNIVVYYLIDHTIDIL